MSEWQEARVSNQGQQDLAESWRKPSGDSLTQAVGRLRNNTAAHRLRLSLVEETLREIQAHLDGFELRLTELEARILEFELQATATRRPRRGSALLAAPCENPVALRPVQKAGPAPEEVRKGEPFPQKASPAQPSIAALLSSRAANRNRPQNTPEPPRVSSPAPKLEDAVKPAAKSSRTSRRTLR